MKILSLGMDKNLADQSSKVSRRVLEYSSLVDKYTVVTLADKDGFLDLKSNTRVFLINQNNKILAFWKMINKIKEVLKKDNYDLITVQDLYFIGYLACKLAHKFKIGLEVQVHGFEKFKGARKLLAKHVLQRADSVRTVSQRLKKQLINEFNVEEDMITVVPVYVEIGERRKEKGERKDNKFVFLTVGRLVPVKNIEMQIEAFKEINKEFKDIELWIVGGGEMSRKLKVESEKLKLDNVVKFWGYQENLDEFYNKADCFLLTSDSEGYGMVIIEAASYGLPIIMTDVGCAGEFIKDRENAIVIPIRDKEALEDNMAELIQNSDLRAELGNNARESVQNLLNKEETLNLYLRSWQKAIK